jgi:acyl-coenzyme A thioesterase PaaI-like protein
MSNFAKQPNAQMCFVCGMENPIGLKMHFYQDEAGRVLARFVPQKEHEGYPGVVHGGIVTAILDEVLGRAAIAADHWSMTVKLNIRFRKPVPTLKPLTAIGEVVSKKRNLLELRGAILLEDGQIATEASGTFIKVDDSEVEGMMDEAGYWEILPDPIPPDFTDIP